MSDLIKYIPDNLSDAIIKLKGYKQRILTLERTRRQLSKKCDVFEKELREKEKQLNQIKGVISNE